MQPSTDRLKELIASAEQAAPFGLLPGHDIDCFLQKIQTSAEIFSWAINENIHAFIAFYCNDKQSLTAFISMVVVDPPFRGLGIGRSLIEAVLAVARSRKFRACRLRVHKENCAANKLYIDLGFRVSSPDGDYLEMELLL